MNFSNEVLFWDNRAEDFPRYNDNECRFTSEIIDKIQQHNVTLSKQHVLDVGCGTGAYSLKLAKTAAWVTALDFSSAMLKILEKDAKQLSIDNLNIIQADWNSFIPNDKFDIVFCSLVPAICDDLSRSKLLDSAKKWTIFIGFSKRLNSNILSALFTANQLEVILSNYCDSFSMKQWLRSRGIDFSSFIFSSKWSFFRNHQEITNLCNSLMIRYGSEYKVRENVHSLVEKVKRSSSHFHEITEYELDVIIIPIVTAAPVQSV